MILIQQVSAPSLKPDRVFQEHVAVDGELGSVKDFNVLGQRGLMAQFTRYEMKSPYEREVVPMWSAAAVVPGAGAEGQDLGVVIDVRGMAVNGPAGSRLLRQVADGLSLRGTQPASTSDVKPDSPGK